MDTSMRSGLLKHLIACQIVGFAAGMLAGHSDMLMWFFASVVLLPGSLVDLLLFRPHAVGSFWPKWTLFAIPIALNVLVYALAAVVYRRRGQHGRLR